ncbi:hypothetical protein [Candidatus Nitrosotenuis sp. DW1]|nr:hypothetical protein [Candidatus Nitrosotenuis sp. DW1]
MKISLMLWGNATLMTDLAEFVSHYVSAAGPEWQIIKKEFG